MAQKFFSTLLLLCHFLATSQHQTFNSEYDKLTWPVKLGVGGGLTGDDGNYKRLTLFHGHSIALQTGSNDRNHSNTRLYVNASGNVGIGTTSPSSKFDLTGNVGEKSMIHITNASVGSDGGYFDINMGTLDVYAAGMKAYVPSGQPGIDRVYLGLYTTTHNGSTVTSRVERMTITDKGNVGIGTTNPSQKLELLSSDRPIGRFVGTHSTDSYFTIGNTSSGHAKLVLDGQDGNVVGGDYATIYNVHSSDPVERHLRFQTNATDRMVIDGNGNIGIGTTNPDTKLTVKGTIHSEEVKVDLSVPGPDYVFEPDYDLRTLEETKEYITEHKHLPEIPSAKEMEANGIEISDMNMRLLKKIEELTLYQIELLERLEVQQVTIRAQQVELDAQQKRITKLEKKVD